MAHRNAAQNALPFLMNKDVLPAKLCSSVLSNITKDNENCKLLAKKIIQLGIGLTVRS